MELVGATVTACLWTSDSAGDRMCVCLIHWGATHLHLLQHHVV